MRFGCVYSTKLSSQKRKKVKVKEALHVFVDLNHKANSIANDDKALKRHNRSTTNQI